MAKETDPSEAAIRAKLLEFAEARADGATFCPSEVARALATNWRPLMEDIRKVAAELVCRKQLACTQKGKIADPFAARGPIRLSRPANNTS